MESESSVATGPSSLGINSKLDTPNVFAAFHSFSQPSSLAPFNNSSYQTPYPSLHYQSSANDLFDNSKNMPMNTPRSNLENATMQSLQSRMMENNKLANASQQDKISLTQSPSAMNSGVPVNGPGTPSAGHQSFAYDERFHALYEREIRWNEVRRYIDLIRRVATDAAHIELTKDAFYDLYNMALLLLKAVDSLDPDKNKKTESGQYFQSQMSGALTPSGTMIATPLGMNTQAPITDADILSQQRKSYDLYGGMRNQGASNAFDGATYLSAVPKYAALPTEQTIYAYSQAQEGNMGVGGGYNPNMQMGGGGYPAQGGGFKGSGGSTPTSAAEPKNFTGEVFFDDVGQGADGNRPKRRRRRTVYSSRRNLHCHMCGVTETPEWRRGPAGDHTLCNACGLHYAKSLKKQRKERDTRKHSIDMLLNESQQPIPPSQNANGAPLGNSPINGNHSSPDSSQEDMTPPTDLLSPN